jgi:hypothetical protein
MFQSGSNIGIGTTMPGSTLDIAGDISLNGDIRSSGDTVLPFKQLLSMNTGLGFGVLRLNGGANNTAIGLGVLSQNTSGGGNTGVGSSSLGSNINGGFNTAIGYGSLSANTTGSFNTALGAGALGGSEGSSNTAIGNGAMTQGGGFNNIAIGAHAAFNVFGGSANIHIGTEGAFNDTATIRIGANPALGDPFPQTSFFAAGIRGITTAKNDSIPVVIDSNGQLGTVSSSRRFKEQITDMGDASASLMRLRPVTFRYQRPFADGSKPIQFGLIAEEVEEVYPDLVAHSADGQVESVKYQVLDSMLLNEVQRLNRENQNLQERLARLEAAFEQRNTTRRSGGLRQP